MRHVQIPEDNMPQLSWVAITFFAITLPKSNGMCKELLISVTFDTGKLELAPTFVF